MMELKLVGSRDPILRKPAERFDFANPPYDPSDLARAMVKCMIDNNGLGLSACQVGLPYAVFAMVGQPNYVFFNPKVVSTSSETIELDEGCLSFPGVTAKIRRPRHARLRFTMPDGETTTKQFTGMSARVILHEMDHLAGKIFLDHLPRFKRDKLLSQSTKSKRNEQKKDPFGNIIDAAELAILFDQGVGTR